jgi:eukaryotic-like serine/threonine-protein kinase
MRNACRIARMAAQETILNERYRLLAQQGSGGMAVVYRAQDILLGRTVAIKILRPSLTSDPSFLTRFRQEARNVANLAHPNIVTLYDVGQDGNTYYMVMEFIDGQDLKKIIRANAPFSIERMLHIGIQICAGIGYAHRAGLVHADIKPQNILITGNDTVKITDFGIAQALSLTQPQERQSVVWGSPHYFSPEQASGETPTPASDVYAIGIVLFEMLTGKLPYVGSDQQELALAHIRETVPHVMEFNPAVPVHLDRIIYKVMGKQPADRYRTADQLGRILISYKQGGQEVTANVQPSPPAGQPPVQSPVPNPIQPANPQAPFGAPNPAFQPPQAPQGQRPPTTYTPLPPRQTNIPPYTPPPSQPAAQPGNRPFTTPSAPTMTNMPRNDGSVQSMQPGIPQPIPGDGNRNPANNPPMYNVPSYSIPSPPPTLDVVTLLLGFIAFAAVIGLLILFVLVANAWVVR